MIYRPDIDGMRGMAVLAVVASHAFRTDIPNGFFDVKIFFFISCYLFTNIFLIGFPEENYFSDFYARVIGYSSKIKT